MKQVKYKDPELQRLFKRKKQPHSTSKRMTPFPYAVYTSNSANIILCNTSVEKK